MYHHCAGNVNVSNCCQPRNYSECSHSTPACGHRPTSVPQCHSQGQWQWTPTPANTAQPRFNHNQGSIQCSQSCCENRTITRTFSTVRKVPRDFAGKHFRPSPDRFPQRGRANRKYQASHGRNQGKSRSEYCLPGNEQNNRFGSNRVVQFRNSGRAGGHSRGQSAKRKWDRAPSTAQYRSNRGRNPHYQRHRVSSKEEIVASNLPGSSSGEASIVEKFARGCVVGSQYQTKETQKTERRHSG